MARVFTAVDARSRRTFVGHTLTVALVVVSLSATHDNSLLSHRPSEQSARVSGDVERLVTVVLTVSDFERAVDLYGGIFGLDLHVDDHKGDDPWISGRHAAASWTEGAFIHFALYETKDGTFTSGAQVAFHVADVWAAHQRAVDAGVEVIHGPKAQPWGTSSRYRDDDGNIIELAQPT
jgi:catechol 2,3-dioxygenase-like lactoylglutathione lyase family enzyme